MHESPQTQSEAQLITVIRALSRSTDHLRHAYADSRGIYHTDFRALLLIHCSQQQGRPLTAGELATALELSSGAVTYLVERLASADLVRREVDPLDRRKVLLCASTKGGQLVRAYLAPMTGAVDQAVTGFTAEQLATALEVMGAVDDAIRTHAEELRHQQQ